MKIYIAASWKHKHAVEMLTANLRVGWHAVFSFVENDNTEGIAVDKPHDFEKWVWTEDGGRSFAYDSDSAMMADLVIYIGPSGKDAAAECGMAYAKGVPLFALYAKGEDFGLMRRMFTKWFDDYRTLLAAVNEMELVSAAFVPTT